MREPPRKGPGVGLRMKDLLAAGTTSLTGVALVGALFVSLAFLELAGRPARRRRKLS